MCPGSSVVERSPRRPLPIRISSQLGLRGFNRNPNPGGRMANQIHESEPSNFEITSKRRKGFPSETRVKRGVRIVHGIKELSEKLGRNDPCPCGSRRSFKNCCLRCGRYDGANRNHFFPGIISFPRAE